MLAKSPQEYLFSDSVDIATKEKHLNCCEYIKYKQIIIRLPLYVNHFATLTRQNRGDTTRVHPLASKINTKVIYNMQKLFI